MVGIIMMPSKENTDRVYKYCFDDHDKSKPILPVHEDDYCDEFVPRLKDVPECCYNCRNFSYVKYVFNTDDDSEDEKAGWNFKRLSAVKGKVHSRLDIMPNNKIDRHGKEKGEEK